MSYCDAGHCDTVTFDCCDRCFAEMVEPALAALGFTRRERKIDW